MLRSAARSTAPLSRRAFAHRLGAVRAASSSPFPDDPPPPPPSWISAATIYPFILLSAITSLALNLSHQRTARETEGAHYRAQISVLETLLARLRTAAASGMQLTDAEKEEVERELELVGLGRGKGKQAVEAEGAKREETSWTEVFFGKKGKGYEEEDNTDWEKVFREADEAEKARAAAPEHVVPPLSALQPATSQPIPAPASATPTPSTSSSPPPPSSAKSARPVYL